MVRDFLSRGLGVLLSSANEFGWCCHYCAPIGLPWLLSSSSLIFLLVSPFLLPIIWSICPESPFFLFFGSVHFALPPRIYLICPHLSFRRVLDFFVPPSFPLKRTDGGFVEATIRWNIFLYFENLFFKLYILPFPKDNNEHITSFHCLTLHLI